MKSSKSNKPSTRDLRAFLNQKVDQYNRTSFIENDPISVPHQFQKKQDIEIAGFWTATFSWGLRKTIIAKSKLLFELMDNAPHDFIVHHKESDRERLMQFKHRTFLPDDTLVFLDFLQNYYSSNDSLEQAFFTSTEAENVKAGIAQFRTNALSNTHFLKRTEKHISNPMSGSACKRINMFLRWMVRKDDRNVDFGIWKRIHPRQLVIPLDLHVHRVARKLGLISSQKTNWDIAEKLTRKLKSFDPMDPVKYDFALFGLGVLEERLF